MRKRSWLTVWVLIMAAPCLAQIRSVQAQHHRHDQAQSAATEERSARESRRRDVFSRYVGVLHHDRLKLDQLVKLDFIVSRSDEQQFQLRAVLTLHFGDFASGEYVSTHFDDVHYSFLTNQLSFDDPDQELVLQSKRFAPEAGELVMTVRSKWLGAEVGTLVLQRDGTARPRHPLIAPVWGHYRGVCDSIPTDLQLYTFRSDKTLTFLSNPFAEFEIRGQLGERRDESSPTQVWDAVIGATYDYFNGIMTVSSYRSMQCDVRAGGLICNGCFLRRISDELEGSLSSGMFPHLDGGKSTVKRKRLFFRPPTSPEAFPRAPAHRLPVIAGEGEELGGVYHGYVHHEYLNRFQRTSISLAMVRDGHRLMGRRAVSSAATLFFGEEKDGERLSYPFVERPLVQLYLTPPLMVLAYTQGDTDAIVQITSVGRGVLRGIWYSRIFGRVGTFEVRRSGLPPLPPGARIVQRVGDTRYEGRTMDLRLFVRNAGADLRNDNPFAPNIFQGGYFNYRYIEAPRAMGSLIVDGSYDFYTGRIAVQRAPTNGNGLYLLVGQRLSRDWLRLSGVRKGISLLFQPHTPMLFRRVPYQ